MTRLRPGRKLSDVALQRIDARLLVASGVEWTCLTRFTVPAAGHEIYARSDMACLVFGGSAWSAGASGPRKIPLLCRSGSRTSRNITARSCSIDMDRHLFAAAHTSRRGGGYRGEALRNRLEQVALMASTTGQIKRKTDKGFGFIAAADGTEYFFHQSGCVATSFDQLREGQRVSHSRSVEVRKARERKT